MKQPKSLVIIIAAVLAALVLIAGGCSIDGEVKEFRDPSVPIEVEKGDEFAIVLESNPTTGYQWKLAEPLDEEIITLEKTEFEAPDEELVGAPGEEIWTFKAQNLGETEIELAYVRPWEEEAAEPEEGTSPEETTMEEGEGETEPETGEGQQEEEPETIAEEETTTMTFHVVVRKAGSMDKEAKKYEDPETPIEVDEGLEFAIVLESNPTTGYSWQLSEPLDEDIVELVSTEFETKSTEGEEEIVGAPGEEVWTFKAIGQGDTEIAFEYVRPWEEDAAPEEEETFKVTVKEVQEEETEE